MEIYVMIIRIDNDYVDFNRKKNMHTQTQIMINDKYKLLIEMILLDFLHVDSTFFSRSSNKGINEKPDFHHCLQTKSNFRKNFHEFCNLSNRMVLALMKVSINLMQIFLLISGYGTLFETDINYQSEIYQRVGACFVVIIIIPRNLFIYLKKKSHLLFCHFSVFDLK